MDAYSPQCTVNKQGIGAKRGTTRSLQNIGTTRKDEYMDLQRPKHDLKKRRKQRSRNNLDQPSKIPLKFWKQLSISAIESFRKAFAEIDILTISFYNTVRRYSKKGRPPTVRTILIWQIAHSLSQKV